MRTMSIAVALLLMAGLFVGCQNEQQAAAQRDAWQESLVTPGETRRERQLRIQQITLQQLRMITDDWDTFWLYDRSSRLTPWYVDVGH